MSSPLQPVAPSIVSQDRSLDDRIRFLAVLSGTLIALVAILALGTGLTLGRQGTDSGMALSAESIRWLSITAVALVAGAAMLVVALVGRATAQSASGTLGAIAGLVDRLVAGDLSLTLPASADASLEGVHHSFRLLSKSMRENVLAAESLALGAYRRVSPPRAGGHPMTVALGQIAVYMDRMAGTAHRIARGDLSTPVETPAPADTLGQANVAMVRQIVSVVREVEAMKQSITATAEAMRAELDELVSGTGTDAEQLRRVADRLSQMALQAHSNANRATALEERSEEAATMVRDGASAIDGSIGALKEACRQSGVVQELARAAGLLAVTAASRAQAPIAGADSAGIDAGVSLEEEARALTTQAASAAREIGRLSRDGIDAGSESLRVLDRMADGIHENRQVVRELAETARSHSAELLAMDEAVAVAHLTARQSATMARQLAVRVESLASHARRLDALLRRFQKGGAPASTARAWEMAGPVLYRTPAAPVTAHRSLAIAGR